MAFSGFGCSSGVRNDQVEPQLAQRYKENFACFPNRKFLLAIALVIGGDDGSLANFEPKSQHPGFPKRVLSYDTKADRWSVVDEAPASRATLPTVPWGDLFVIRNCTARSTTERRG